MHKMCKNMSQFNELQNITEIDAFALSLKKWMQWTMKKKMLWKNLHDQFNSYWSDECRKTIKKMKKILWIFINS